MAAGGLLAGVFHVRTAVPHPGTRLRPAAHELDHVVVRRGVDGRCVPGARLFRSLSGYDILPGAADLLAELERRAVSFVVLTNGSAFPPAEQAAKLRGLGLAVCDDGAP